MKELFIEITEIESNNFVEFDLPYQWFIDNELIFRISELKKYEER